MTCPYANALGVPGEGIHAARISGSLEMIS